MAWLSSRAPGGCRGSCRGKITSTAGACTAQRRQGSAVERRLPPLTPAARAVFKRAVKDARPARSGRSGTTCFLLAAACRSPLARRPLGRRLPARATPRLRHSQGSGRWSSRGRTNGPGPPLWGADVLSKRPRGGSRTGSGGLWRADGRGVCRPTGSRRPSATLLMPAMELPRGPRRPSLCPDPARGHPRQSWLPGPVHQPTIGGDPVGRLPAAMPKTISAVGRLRRSASALWACTTPRAGTAPR